MKIGENQLGYGNAKRKYTRRILIRRLYRFIVCRNADFFEVWVQKKVIDEYLNPDEIFYSDFPDITIPTIT